jgi:hypothetical protein
MMAAKENAVDSSTEQMPLTRGMVIAKILSARTLEGCERADALIGEWMKAHPDDEEVMSYGSFVARMESAIRWEAKQP